MYWFQTENNMRAELHDNGKPALMQHCIYAKHKLTQTPGYTIAVLTYENVYGVEQVSVEWKSLTCVLCNYQNRFSVCGIK